MNARFGRFSRAAGENLADFDNPNVAYPTGVRVLDGVVYETGASGVHNLALGITAAPGGVEIVASVDVHPPHVRWQGLHLFFNDANWNRYVWFDLDAGTVDDEGSEATGTIEALDDGGWRLGIVTTTPASPDPGSYALIQWSEDREDTPDAYPSYVGVGRALARLSGFQVEEASIPSARIPAGDTVTGEYSGELLVPGGAMFAVNLDGVGSGDVVAVEVSYDSGSTWHTMLAVIPVATPARDFWLGAAGRVRLNCTTLATGPVITYHLRRAP